MHLPRSAGILLHISSLPGSTGIGDLGDEAHRFVEYLHQAGQSYWQILPLGPSDDGNPYVAQSSWAGSPFLLSLEELVKAGDLTSDELASARRPDGPRIDYELVRRTRSLLLPLAAKRFFARGDEQTAFESFSADHASWLKDWSFFAAIKRRQLGKPWWEWPAGLALRKASDLEAFRREHEQDIRAERYYQYRFYQQLGRLRTHAGQAGVRLIGDIPIYAARDSADVWAAREYFLLDEQGCPKVVSGVPPDCFAKDGQLWGTPVYDWERNRRQDYVWWIARLRGLLDQVDVVRIDHFRAFESYWEVPAGASTAKGGRWVKGPGDSFFEAVRRALGAAPFIAEDLGTITRPVRELRDRWELPGMRVLQFAFGEGAASPHLPIRFLRNSVVYTGTHDNDTTVGWYEKASAREKDMFRRFTASDGRFCHYHMIRLAYGSIADLAVVPMQDVLGLGSEARMNRPGLADGNWHWKLAPGQTDQGSAHMLCELAETFGRLPGQKEAIDE